MEAYWFIKDKEELEKFIEEEKAAIKKFAADPTADRNWYSKAIRKECQRRKEWLWKQVDRWHEANKVQAK
jgi:hypothetical protein